MNLKEVKHIYFLGIGGIGMSALARYFLRRGVRISGYDKTPSDLTTELQQEGMEIHFDDSISKIPRDLDLVVVTPAIPRDHQEWNELQKQNIPILKRAAVLGMISRESVCLAVAGTHGKTTTSTLLTHILRCSGVDCTAFLGGIAVDYNANYIEGKSDIVVVEADEYDRSFLQLNPSGLIITAVDPDHLDIYGTAAEMLNTYSQFTGHVREGGMLVTRKNLPLHVDQKLSLTRKVTTYGTTDADFYAENIRIENGFFVFDFISNENSFMNIKLSIAGRHNIENATAAIALGLNYGANESGIRKALGEFKGIKRRFEWILRNEKYVMIDDYAHHPEELRAAISATRELFPGKIITGVFQPHLYSRTRDFADGFARSLELLDEVLLLEIYPARELPIEGVNAKMILDKMNHPNKEVISKEELIQYIGKRKPEVLITLGAGDIDRLVEPLKKELLKN